MYGHRTRKNLGAALRLIATAALASSVAAQPAQALSTGPSVTHSKITTVVASVTAYVTHSAPECNVDYGTSLTVTGTPDPTTGTSWHVKLLGSTFPDCRTGGADDTVVVDEELQPGEFVVSRDLDHARIDADVTFGILRYQEEPFSSPGHLTVEWTAKGARTIERVTVRTPTGWTRTTTRERPSNVSTLQATPHPPGVWGGLVEAQTTAFLEATTITTLQR